MNKIYPVIMCGGIGSRLWPLSRPDTPKQFVQLLGQTSLFKATAARCMTLDNVEQTVVVAGIAHRQLVETQLNSMPVPGHILLEPEGRDSAAAVAVAVAYVERRDPDAVLAIMASDHFIPDYEHFKSDIQDAIKVAQSGKIVMLGITPTSPNSAYGYIQGENDKSGISNVVEFHEKPDAETAADYISKGYSWNSGNFIASAKTLRAEFERFAPDIPETVGVSLEESETAAGVTVLSDQFTSVRRISIDHAIMEKTDSASVLKTDLVWSDLGAWDAVHAVAPKDGDGNYLSGDGILENCRNSNVRVADDRFAVVSSVDGLNVVVEDDVVFVSTLSEAQRVKTVYDKLTELQRPEVQSSQNPAMALEDQSAQLSSWYKNQTLPLWACYGFNREAGIWHENLTSDLRPADNHSRARVQGRQGFVFALAMPGSPASRMWQQMVELSLKGIETTYLNEQDLLQTLVDSQGRSLDKTVKLYDQTFWLSAQAKIVEALSDEDTAASKEQIEQIHKTASKTLEQLKISFSQDVYGGFAEEGTTPFLSNPLMHLFETTLMWRNACRKSGIDPSQWIEVSDRLGKLALEKLFDPERKCIAEIYSDIWQPHPNSPIDPGHQFEWAWLLVTWYRISGNRAALDCAHKLFETGNRGRHPNTGAIALALNNDFTISDDTARLWTQTEWLKASLILFEESGRSEHLRGTYRDNINRAFLTMTRYFETSVAGLWYDKLKADNTFVEEPSPTSSMYHIASAVQQLEETARNGSK